MKYHTLRLSVAAVLTAVLLAACGGSGSSSDSGGGSSGGGSSGGGSSGGKPIVAGLFAECQPPNIHYTATYKLTNPSIGAVGTQIISDTSGESSTLNGQSLLKETQTTQTSYKEGPFAGRSIETVQGIYYTQPGGQYSTRNYYAETKIYGVWDQLGKINKTVVDTYDTPIADDTPTILPGQKLELHRKGTRQNQVSGQTPTAESFYEVDNKTYYGQETVITPAGTFTACKLGYGGVPEHIEWYAKDSGIIVKKQMKYVTDANYTEADIFELIEIKSGQ